MRFLFWNERMTTGFYFSARSGGVFRLPPCDLGPVSAASAGRTHVAHGVPAVRVVRREHGRHAVVLLEGRRAAL